jgi:uncharacterized protein
MKFSKTEKELMKIMDSMEIIDCHEHLAPEDVRTSSPVDVFSFFSHYTKGDLSRAGMSEKKLDSLFNQDIPLETRWKTFAPFWQNTRYTSYSRAVLIALEKFYGFDDITEKNYISISEKMKESNKPGIYKKILREACNIKTCITQCGRTDLGTDLLTPVMPMHYNMETKEDLLHPSFDKKTEIKSFDDYLAATERYILRVKREGAVGLKITSIYYSKPDKKEAESFFNRIVSGKTEVSEDFWSFHSRPSPLRSYITDMAIGIAGKQNLVMAVHTGYWGDFRKLHPLHMIPLLMKHPDTRFDIYHLGYPWVRDGLMLAKGFSNVWLNLCWTHIISQKFAMDGLDEAIDLVPANKILAFGGDYLASAVEKVYGHLAMAKEDVSRVLAARIDRGALKKKQAEYMIRRWFRDNPVELYNLNFSKEG